MFETNLQPQTGRSRKWQTQLAIPSCNDEIRLVCPRLIDAIGLRGRRNSCKRPIGTGGNA